MWNSLIARKFNSLWIYHQKPNFFRGRIVENRCNNGIDANTFTSSSGTSNKEMWHFGQVCHGDIPHNIKTEGNCEFPITFSVVITADQVTYKNSSPVIIRDFNSQSCLSGY